MGTLLRDGVKHYEALLWHEAAVAAQAQGRLAFGSTASAQRWLERLVHQPGNRGALGALLARCERGRPGAPARPVDGAALRRLASWLAAGRVCVFDPERAASARAVARRAAAPPQKGQQAPSAERRWRSAGERTVLVRRSDAVQAYQFLRTVQVPMGHVQELEIGSLRLLADQALRAPAVRGAGERTVRVVGPLEEVVWTEELEREDDPLLDELEQEPEEAGAAVRQALEHQLEVLLARFAALLAARRAALEEYGPAVRREIAAAMEQGVAQLAALRARLERGEAPPQQSGEELVAEDEDAEERAGPPGAREQALLAAYRRRLENALLLEETMTLEQRRLRARLELSRKLQAIRRAALLCRRRHPALRIGCRLSAANAQQLQALLQQQDLEDEPVRVRFEVYGFDPLSAGWYVSLDTREQRIEGRLAGGLELDGQPAAEPASPPNYPLAFTIEPLARAQLLTVAHAEGLTEVYEWVAAKS
ncbi:MAG: hypothetical protein KatS3mg102_0117 [Planctomycetota bacterium]|nr:MAG: hypothetical protein KatS3mg102_0117 [Planctomycetota bacterium]